MNLFCRVGDLALIEISRRQKSEENLSATETALEKQMAVNADLAKNIDEMQLMTDEIAKLKDQVDE